MQSIWKEKTHVQSPNLKETIIDFGIFRFTYFLLYLFIYEVVLTLHIWIYILIFF